MAASPALLAQALGQQTRPAAPTNPYASGISVAGTGPGGTASNWTTGMGANGQLYANTGFGQAPIYTADQFAKLAPNAQTGAVAGSPNEFFALQPAAGNTQNPYGASIPYTYDANGNVVDNTAQPGSTLDIKTGGTGSQQVAYKLDPKTGDYIPASASGSAGGGNWADNLIKYGAMAGGAIADGAGAMGLGSAGPGASALGGSADLASSVGEGGLTAVEDAGATAFPVNAPGAAQTSELAPLSTGGQTFDASSMVQDIVDSAAASSAPQLAADQSAIAGQGMQGIAADAANLGAGGGSSLLSNKNLINALQKVVGQAISPGQVGGSPTGGGSSGGGYGGGSLGGMAVGTAGMQPTGFRGNLEGPLTYQGTNPMALAAALKQMLGPQQPHSQYGVS